MVLNKIELQLLSFFFAAILPPKNDNGTSDREEDCAENSYYACLGAIKSSTVEDIRKAYKKKSLQYHPDKIAQFASADNTKSQEEIQSYFLKVKEAYETLSDPQRRNAYDVLGEEGAKLINQSEGGGEFDMFERHLLIHNLARATIYNKTKLILLILFLSLIVLLGPTLLFLKADGRGAVRDRRWVLVLVPIWVLNALLLLFTVSSHRWLRTLLISCIVTGEVLLALRWDEIIMWDYTFVFVPFYLHQFIILFKSALEIQQVRKDLDRIVTVSFLEERVLPIYREKRQEEKNVGGFEVPQWCSYDNLTERERDIINKEFIIINDPPDRDDNISNESVDPENKLWFTVSRSPEYKCAIKVKFRAVRTIALILSTRAAFFFLVAFQLDQNKRWNWFLIFIPIWVEVGLVLCSSCWTCCCYGVIREEEVDKDSEIITSEADDEGGKTEYFSDEYDAPIKTEGEDRASLWIDIDEENVDESVAINSAKSQDDFHRDGPSLVASSRYESIPSTKPDLDSHSIEKQVKASIWSVVYIVFATILALLLVKLNGVEDGVDSKNDYSAFWVTLPIILVLGIASLCACGCICCAIDVDALETIIAREPSFSSSEQAVDDIQSVLDTTLEGNETNKIHVDDSDSNDLD